MSYEATKRWRERHPEAARALARQSSARRRRRLGVPAIGDRGPYLEAMDARKAKREKMAKIIEEAKLSTCKLRMRK